MSSITGARGSARRKLVVCGVLAVGAVVLFLAGYMAEVSVKQVYWAVYSRLHPMRDGAESYAFSQQKDRRRELALQQASESGAVTRDGVGAIDDGVVKGSAAAAAVAAGEKKVVALLPTEKEQIKHRAHEQTAAREAHQREAEMQDAKESKRVQDVAEQQLAKATAAYSAEIAAVAGPKEADRLQDKMWEDQGQTKLEKEAAVSTALGQRHIPHRSLRSLTDEEPSSTELAGTVPAGLRRPAGGRRTVLAGASLSVQNNLRKRKPKPGLADAFAGVGKALGARFSGGGDWSGAGGTKTSGGVTPHSRVSVVGGGSREASESQIEQSSQGIKGAGLPISDGGRPALNTTPQLGQMKRVREWSGRPHDYVLTRERVAAVAKDGVVLMTWANHHYLDFALNWAGHLQKLGVKAWLIGALDNELLKDLVEMGVDNAFAMQTSLEAGDLSWGSPHFFQMGREKIQLVEKFASMGFDVIISDVDTAWMKDPIPYMARYPEADILVSSDHISNTTNDDGLEKFPEAGSACNIGIIMFRSSAIEFAKEWNDVLSKDDLYWDQNAFNDLFRRGMDVFTKRTDRLFRGYDRKLLVGILPVALFASGHTFYIQELARKMQLEPYVVHGTFQFSGTPGKRHRLRERHLWLPDDEQYFDPPGGLMSFSLRVSHLLEPASHLKLTGELDDLNGHFALANAQLTQIRNALAVATALNRTLVLPRMFTGVDRWWAPHRGLIPGSQGVTLPMFAPADHILDIDMMAKHWEEGEFGPDTPFREYSFLQNERTPAAIAKDRLRVSICEEWEAGCTTEGSSASQNAGKFDLRLQYGLNDKQLQRVFKDFNSTKLIHFDDLSRGIGTFENNEDFQKFVKRTSVYASIWCCVDRHPGHIWYDMWWDSSYHIDRHGREFHEWELLTGP